MDFYKINCHLVLNRFQIIDDNLIRGKWIIKIQLRNSTKKLQLYHRNAVESMGVMTSGKLITSINFYPLT